MKGGKAIHRIGDGKAWQSTQLDRRSTKRAKADHGVSYVPGAGDEDQAPKSLDHFKRGYHERAQMRDRQNHDRNDYHPRNSGSAGGPPNMLQGVDVGRILDRCQQNKQNLFEELDRVREEYRQLFDSGKAMTALISGASRRRDTPLASACWDYMESRAIPKNVYHFNAMISAMEKDRNWRRAMDLLKEMDQRNIPKNEVTYVSIGSIRSPAYSTSHHDTQILECDLSMREVCGMEDCCGTPRSNGARRCTPDSHSLQRCHFGLREGSGATEGMRNLSAYET